MVAEAAIRALAEWVANPTEPVERGRDTKEVLFRASLPLSGAVRDDDGMPRLDSLDPTVASAALLDPASPELLLQDYLRSGDLATASILAADDSRDALDDARSAWAAVLRNKASAVARRLDRVRAQSLLAQDEADLEARLLSAQGGTEDRFDRAMAALAMLDAELVQRQAQAIEELRGRLASIAPGPAITDRVSAVIDQEDLPTANEFLALLERGEPLPSIDIEESAAFREFSDALKGLPQHSTAVEVAEAFGGANLNSPRTKDGLGAWAGLAGTRTPAVANQVRAVLRLLGLDVTGTPGDVTDRGRSGFKTFRVTATPADASFVPDLGTKTTHYLVTVVFEQKDPRLTLDLIPAHDRVGPNILLLPGAGVLPARARTDYLIQARNGRITTLVVDSACLGYLAARDPGSFLGLQRLTLPYATFPHYTPFLAGDVPDEVFVGRDSEMEQIASPTGSLFVYGGRQLGKSALLRRVQRDFNRRHDHVAIFIDLKARGVGEREDASHLWPVLLEELKAAEIATARHTSPRPENVTRLIRDWLDEVPSRRLLLLLDEADLFLENESRERLVQGRRAIFPNVLPLKALMDNTGRRFKPVFAGLHQVQRLQKISNTPLAHGGTDILIGPLDQQAARRLVVRPFTALGYRFDSLDLVWRLLAFTNYQPGLVQIVCDALLRELANRRPRPGEPPITVTAEDIDRVTSDPTVRKSVADRFNLTLNLEDRYLVIALTVAVLSVADRYKSSLLGRRPPVLVPGLLARGIQFLDTDGVPFLPRRDGGTWRPG